MSKKPTPLLPILFPDSASTSAEEDFSSEDDGAPKAEDFSESRNAPGKERVGPLDKRVWAGVSKEHYVFLPKDLERKIPTPMFMTTAEQRTRENMFGEINAVFEQIAIADPVLYVALYSTGEESSEVDDYHWVFIVGPSHEEADSKGTQSSMEPLGRLEYISRKHKEWQWRWLYNQRTIPLRGQPDLLIRLMVAEVADLEMLQAVVLRWALCVCMRAHPEWMSVKWVKNVLNDLDTERGCLGRRMESFKDVEALGRRCAKMEEDKRKGFSLLDTRVSTRFLFAREALAISSTTTVDIAIKYPVLYVDVYAGVGSPHGESDFYWTFLIGPSNDEAKSVGVHCGIEFHIDSGGRRTWSYNQTIVRLCGHPGLLVRMLLADIVDLRPLGEILHDQNSTPTAERPGSMGESSEWTSLAWVREKLEMLERKPECFSYKCSNFCDFESMGRRAAESLGKKRKKKLAQPFTFTKICLVSNWKPPDDDEANVAVNSHILHGRPFTLSRTVQIATGRISIAVLTRSRQPFGRENQEIRAKQEVEERTTSKQIENAATLAKPGKPQGADEGTKNAKNEERHMMMARRERAQSTTVDLSKLEKPRRAFDENPVTEKDEGKGDQSEDDEDVDKAPETAGSVGERGRTNRLEIARSTTAVNLLELNKLTRMSGRNSVAEEANEHREQSNDKDDSDDDNDVEESDDEDGEDEEEDDEDDEREKGKAKGDVFQRRVTGRPDDVRRTAIHVLMPNKPDRAVERKTEANQKGEDSSDSEDEEEKEESGDGSIDEEDKDNHDEEDEVDDSNSSADNGSNKGEDENSDKDDEEEGEDSDDESVKDEGEDEGDDEGDDDEEDNNKDDEDEVDDSNSSADDGSSKEEDKKSDKEDEEEEEEGEDSGDEDEKDEGDDESDDEGVGDNEEEDNEGDDEDRDEDDKDEDEDEDKED